MLGFEASLWSTLALIVSLEAIFLSTSVMIAQNRQASLQQTKADHDYGNINTLLVENTKLTRTSHDRPNSLPPKGSPRSRHQPRATRTRNSRLARCPRRERPDALAAERDALRR
jgi:uncharacterized membrane protein